MTPQQGLVTVSSSQLDRAAKLATAMTAHPLTTTPDDGEWTVQDVLAAALGRGLDELEKSYLGGRS